MLSCECQINNYKLIYILHDHGPATTIDFHAMICVIGHCFLELQMSRYNQEGELNLAFNRQIGPHLKNKKKHAYLSLRGFD